MCLFVCVCVCVETRACSVAQADLSLVTLEVLSITLCLPNSDSERLSSNSDVWWVQAVDVLTTVDTL